MVIGLSMETILMVSPLMTILVGQSPSQIVVKELLLVQMLMTVQANLVMCVFMKLSIHRFALNLLHTMQLMAHLHLQVPILSTRTVLQMI